MNPDQTIPTTPQAEISKKIVGKQKVMEFHMTESKDKKPLRQRKKECVSEMRDILRLVGYWNLNKTALARKHGVGWSAVDRWYTELLTHVQPERIANIQIMAESSFRTSLAVCERILADPNSKTRDKLDAIGRMNETLQHFTDFLEAYNMKPKVAEQIGVYGEFDLTRILEIAQDRKEITEEKNGNNTNDSGL